MLATAANSSFSSFTRAMLDMFARKVFVALGERLAQKKKTKNEKGTKASFSFFKILEYWLVVSSSLFRVVFFE